MRTRQAVEVLATLGQETRLDVFRLLIQAGPAGLPAGEIAARLKIPLATLSFHLQHLKQARLAHSKKRGKLVIYSANFTTVDCLVGYLLHDCCGRPRTGLEVCGQAASESKAGAKSVSERADS
ncbi:helix-turn-helix transcriptional regulator [Verrucomicrobium sp. 3C]|uniref:ArsR/SmtB family transcription factor n=1 Tax=Verrucomicrobium sp. 3C TaxID=1134055 RepID=UPI00038184C6|nr:metalloregulator ArsR/SmtB family transcription factor [Verrucomicrobium sp. 3C]